MSVYLEWKTIPGDEGNIWIVMTATGTVKLPETQAKMAKLQETLDYFAQHYSQTHKFTFLFDFSRCKDFAKMSMLGDLKAFLQKNDSLIENHLRKSYILLRDPAWNFFLKLVFAFRPPKQPYALKFEDQSLYEILRYRPS